MIKKDDNENIRVKKPDECKNEMYAVVSKVLGGSRMEVNCQDENSRMARIPGSKKRRMGRIRIGGLLIVKPWDIQDDKADIIYHYRNNETKILIKKDILPKNILLFFQR
jgi:translation initiation factor 1A